MTDSFNKLIFVQQERNKKFYFASHNRLRKIDSPKVLSAYSEFSPIEVNEEAISHLKAGPSVPFRYDSRPKIPAQMREYILRDCFGNGLEFGAGYAPARIPIQCDVTYVDRYTDEEMLEFSSAARSSRITSPSPIKIDKIGSFQTMDEFEYESVDFIYAAHVIEHVHDPIGAILEGIKRLRTNGKLILVVPHRDKTFDAARPITSIGHLLNDHLYGGSSLEHCIDRLAYRKSRGDSLISILKDAEDDQEKQVDMHHHTFTPTSFELILRYINEVIAVSRHEVDSGWGQNGVEFYVTITK